MTTAVTQGDNTSAAHDNKMTTTEGDNTSATVDDKTTTTTATGTTAAVMPSLRRIHNDDTAVKMKGASKISQQPVKEKDAPSFDNDVDWLKTKGTNYLDHLPVIDNSLFSSDDFMDAIGCDDDVILPSTDEASMSYARMGTAEESPIAALVKPSKPDCTDMTPTSKNRAMREYILNKKAYQKERKAATDALMKERRRAAGGRAVEWEKIKYTGDNSSLIRSRDRVILHRLQAGHNIMDKEYVRL